MEADLKANKFNKEKFLRLDEFEQMVGERAVLFFEKYFHKALKFMCRNPFPEKEDPVQYELAFNELLKEVDEESPDGKIARSPTPMPL